MHYAESIEEAVKQLDNALAGFLYENRFYRRLFGVEAIKDSWGNLRIHCQQLSQWIEHGCGVTEEMKPELVKTLFAAEKVLSDNEKYSRRKLNHYKG
jgi:hypothetical protein